MDFLSLAKKRYACRKYTAQKVEQAKLDTILEAGRVAPTGANRQPQRLIVVRSEEGMARLARCTRDFGAPCAIIVCADTGQAWERKYDGKVIGDIDASIVTDHMMLCAASLGLDNQIAVKVLGGRDIILFPDLGATDKWKSKIPLLQSVCKRVVISNVLEDNATDEQKTKGLDIADFLMMTETPQMALQRLIKQHPPLQHLIDSLGLVLVEESLHS